MTGSLTGTLVAGHDYKSHYSVYVHAYPSGSSSGATGVGSLSLAFSVIPEPSTALLFGGGLLALGFKRERERREELRRLGRTT